MKWAERMKSLFVREQKDAQFEAVLRMLNSGQLTSSGVTIDEENCEQSPTVKAIVTAVSRRISTLPVQVLKKTKGGGKYGRTVKEPVANHVVAKLLEQPNSWQNRVTFFADAASRLIRYNNFYAYKSRGTTGPIRELVPIEPRNVKITVNDYGVPSYQVNEGGTLRDMPRSKILHVRGVSRNGYIGDPPIRDIREEIALEVAASKFGATFFGNGALPFMLFNFAAGSAGFRTNEEKEEFVKSFQESFSSTNRFKAMLLPKGIEGGKAVPVENDRAQFLQTRQHQRTVIAGAFGVPPHLVGDLSHGTYNNVEQQSLDFVINVVLPFIRFFEAAMEADLLTPADRRNGLIIRFNLEGALRGDFKTRQEGLKIMRDDGIINANEWREMENLNPITKKDGGEDYIRPMNMSVAGDPGIPEDTAGEPPPADDETDGDSTNSSEGEDDGTETSTTDD